MKFRTYIIMIAIALVMSGCSKSKDAQMADAMISSLGEITLKSGDEIAEAEKLVSSLPDSQYDKLENAEALLKARIEYDKLCVSNVESNIEEIVNGSDTTLDKIQTVKELYNQLKDDLKGKVSNYEKLEECEKKIIRDKVEPVEKTIDKIGTVTLDSENAIKIAEEAYESLAPVYKDAVKNYSAISEAKEQLKKLRIADIEKYINGIGEVTTKTVCKLAIQKARSVYESYNEDIRKSISNYDVLVAAEEQYINLNRDEMEKEIDDIGVVTLESEKIIISVRKKYDSLEDDIKAAVRTLSVLEKAESDLSTLKVNEVIDIIESLGEAKLDNEKEISAAQEKYDALTYEQKKAVTNADKLKDARDTVNALKKEKLEKQYETALSKVKKETDSLRKVDRYYPSAWPKYIDTRNYFLPEIYVGSGRIQLYYTLNYTDDTWLFWDRADFYLDSSTPTKSLTVSYFDVIRDNDSGDIWEYYYTKCSEKDIEFLRKVADSKEATVIFYGSKYTDRWTIPEKDKKAIKEILEVYDLMVQLRKGTADLKK